MPGTVSPVAPPMPTGPSAPQATAAASTLPAVPPRVAHAAPPDAAGAKRSLLHAGIQAQQPRRRSAGAHSGRPLADRALLGSSSAINVAAVAAMPPSPSTSKRFSPSPSSSSPSLAMPAPKRLDVHAPASRPSSGNDPCTASPNHAVYSPSGTLYVRASPRIPLVTSSTSDTYFDSAHADQHHATPPPLHGAAAAELAAAAPPSAFFDAMAHVAGVPSFRRSSRTGSRYHAGSQSTFAIATATTSSTTLVAPAGVLQTLSEDAATNTFRDNRSPPPPPPTQNQMLSQNQQKQYQAQDAVENIATTTSSSADDPNAVAISKMLKHFDDNGSFDDKNGSPLASRAALQRKLSGAKPSPTPLVEPTDSAYSSRRGSTVQ